jgi:hypothetical protein
MIICRSSGELVRLAKLGSGSVPLLSFYVFVAIFHVWIFVSFGDFFNGRVEINGSPLFFLRTGGRDDIH